MQANLGDILQTPEIKLGLGVVVRMAIDVANGVHYLHSHCNLIHRYIFKFFFPVVIFSKFLIVKFAQRFENYEFACKLNGRRRCRCKSLRFWCM